MEQNKDYKGFKYKKNQNNEYWYSNKVLRKQISYFSNGNKMFESYWNQKNELHNEDGFACIYYGENGSPNLEQYFLNDKKLSEQEWKEEVFKENNYLNPESFNYYNGYRYEKDSDGDKFWFDENNVVRKKIIYYDNGNKCYERYYNNKEEYHNEEGFAYIIYKENGEIKYSNYYLYGVELTEQEWKKEVNIIKTKGKSVKFGYLDPESEDYYKGFKREENDCGYPRIYWYDENHVMRKEIHYRKKDEKIVIYYEELFNENWKTHDEDGPAKTKWNEDGEVEYQEYYLDGIKVNPKIFNYIKSLKEEIVKLSKQ